jgi:uncharacterized HAD superfamily protein
LRIAIDIDSTLHHYWDQLSAFAYKRFGVSLPYEDQVTWEIERLKPEQVAACVRWTHAPEQIAAAEPYAGAVETLERWHEQGHFIHITSHRDTAAHEATSRWLAEHGIPHDELYCSYDKIAKAVEIGIDVLIDDSPVNLQRALDQGITAATLTHPWNRELCETEDVICAPDWPGLAKALEPVLRGART